VLHARILAQLRESLPEELYEELARLSPEVEGATLPEVALAHSEILGWLEGLFQGTQLALQLEAARALQDQLEHSLPDGKRPKPIPPKVEGAYL
jgi:Bacterial proteasome activator